MKRVEKNAQESSKECLNRQNTARETRKRTRKGISKRRISSEEQLEKEIQRAPENRLKRAYQQREANHKRSEKEEEVSRVIWAFSYAKAQNNSNISFPILV